MINGKRLRCYRDLPFIFFLLFFSSLSIFAQDKVNTSPFSGLAIHGYDPVAYFVQNEAVPGNRDILYEWGGTSWVFASQENMSRFIQSPQSYLPEFGGYCAYAAAHDAISDVDPVAWQIVDGKLYLNYDHKVQRLWANRLHEYIREGNHNWPELVKTLN